MACLFSDSRHSILQERYKTEEPSHHANHLDDEELKYSNRDSSNEIWNFYISNERRKIVKIRDLKITLRDAWKCLKTCLQFHCFDHKLKILIARGQTDPESQKKSYAKSTVSRQLLKRASVNESARRFPKLMLPREQKSHSFHFYYRYKDTTCSSFSRISSLAWQWRASDCPKDSLMALWQGCRRSTGSTRNCGPAFFIHCLARRGTCPSELLPLFPLWLVHWSMRKLILRNA